VDFVAISDLAAFGLVLHSANINEVNRVASGDANWKTVHNGISILFLVMYALLLFAAIAAPPNLNAMAMLISTVFLSVVSFALSWAVFARAKAGQRGRP
jgi:hypothetical protein